MLTSSICADRTGLLQLGHLFIGCGSWEIILENVKSGGTALLESDCAETEKLMGGCSPMACSPSSFAGKVRVMLCQVVSKETGEILSRHMELGDAKRAAGARIDRGDPRPTVRTIYEWIRKDQLASLYQ